MKIINLGFGYASDDNWFSRAWSFDIVDMFYRNHIQLYHYNLIFLLILY